MYEKGIYAFLYHNKSGALHMLQDSRWKKGRVRRDVCCGLVCSVACFSMRMKEREVSGVSLLLECI